VDVAYLSIREAHELLQSKQLSAVELTQYYLDRIAQHDDTVRACLTVCSTEALASAKKVDTKIAAGEDIGLLEGIPYTAKDMFLTKGIRTTAASKILDNFVPPFSATVIEKLDDAGAILIAKTNHDEFGHGTSTKNSGYHTTHNPWNLEHVPGGSSGGSAAAVAADFGIFSLGTDTGGSSRQPAADCGVTGFKPTYGLISRYGVVAMASSFDTVGVLARTAEDVSAVVEAVSGRDHRDATTIDAHVSPDLQRDWQGRSVGVVKEYVDQLEEKSKQLLKQALEDLRSIGVTIKEVSIPTIADALPAYYVLVPSEISSNLSRYDGVRYGHSSEQAHTLRETYDKSRDEGFGDEVKRRVLTGTYALSAGYYDAYYKKAMQVRTQLRQDFAKAMEGVVALVGPTAPSPAVRFAGKRDPIEEYMLDIMTVAANLVGIPSVSVPMGFVGGLPVGLQIMAPQTKDDIVLSLAAAYQSKTAWHDYKQRSPQL
jgi:aspartyl-tRNA(Asn)/glutamyl-tRNA(Gln) amidotransferase subunit A